MDKNPPSGHGSEPADQDEIVTDDNVKMFLDLMDQAIEKLPSIFQPSTDNE